MNGLKKKLFSVLSGALFLGTISAQEVVTTAGGDVSGSGGSVAWSLGQVVYTTTYGSNGHATQGVQQPYTVSIPTNVTDLPEGLSLNAYPNPTTDALELNLGELQLENVRYELTDANGKLVEQAAVSASSTSIAMGQLASATYYLRLLRKDEMITIFRIVKEE